jgi:carboxyl-terminal processing protease
MAVTRLKIGTYAGLTAALFGLASYRFYERRTLQDPPTKEQVLVGTLVQGLSSAHYQPERLNDAFSKRVYELALKRLDYRRKFLLQADVAQLAKYQLDIDDETKRGTREFLDLSTQLLAERTQQVKTLVHELLAQPFTFDADEAIQTDYEKATFPTSVADQREQWRKQLKYETLSRVAELLDEQDRRRTRNDVASMRHKPLPTAPAERTVAQLEVEARKRVLAYYDEQFVPLC